MARKTSGTPSKEDAEGKPKSATAKPAPARPPRARAKAPLAAEDPHAVRPRATMPIVSTEMRHAMVAEAAYYRAERRGEGPGDPLQDWYEAEAEIEQMLEGSVAG